MGRERNAKTIRRQLRELIKGGLVDPDQAAILYHQWKRSRLPNPQIALIPKDS